jgi:hypothetical protein
VAYAIMVQLKGSTTAIASPSFPNRDAAEADLAKIKSDGSKRRM